MKQGIKHILTFPTLLAVLLIVLSVSQLDARTKTTRKNLRSIEVPVVTLDADDGLLPDSLAQVDPDAIAIKGFSKRASDSKESFFVTNRTSHRMSAVRLLLRYTTMSYDEVGRRAGFGSSSLLYQQFRKYRHFTPDECRRSIRKPYDEGRYRV